MKNRKRFFCLLTPVLLGLALAAGCGSPDSSLRDTGKINDYDTVTQNGERIDGYGTLARNGEQIDVCVSHDWEAIYLFYDNENHELFDTAMLPMDEIHQDDKEWELGKIDLSDRTGDSNGDLQVTLAHADMSESQIEWYWEKGAGYVYQPDFSWFYKPIVIYYPDETDYSMYAGLWLSEENSQYDSIEIDGEGNWQLCSGGKAAEEGYLVYDSGEYAFYMYSSGDMDGRRIELEGEDLYIDNCGYFSPHFDYSQDSEVHHRDISEFRGFWYYDGILLPESYIIIDGDGNWSYYEGTPDAPEAVEKDRGTFSCAADESDTYYAESAMHDGVRYQMYDLREGVLLWDDAAYYRTEN